MLPCPTDDVLGALVQRVLDEEESERVRAHLDECELCAQAVAATVRGRASGSEGASTVLGRPILTRPETCEQRDASPIGSKVGRYGVRALLGAGGMGHVYEAYDAELERAIALKVIRPELAQPFTERLVRESRLMAKVSHPSVITVYDVGRDGERVFIAMELIRGATLGAHLARRQAGWREIVELFERAGAGLAAAHRAGIVHRDFKPENVLVELDGDVVSRVVVTDFGIARAYSIQEDPDCVGVGSTSDPRMTSTCNAIGTPAYMAPEQLTGGSVDLRGDVFSFATSLWEALFGVRPFPGTSVEQIRDAMKRSPQPPNRSVPSAVVRVLERGLAIDPVERWPDMIAFVRQLSVVRSRRRRVQLLAGVTALVATGTMGALLAAWPANEDPCSRPSLAVDTAALRTAITDPTALAKIETAVTAWRRTQAATCSADRHPAQAPPTATCLDARRLEITGVVEDLSAARGAQAQRFVALVGDPALCAEPVPSMLFAKVPTDPALRRRVSALRGRLFAAEDARDHANFAVAIAEATQIAAEASQTWPAVHAEALFVLGSAQARGGDGTLAKVTLKQAAAVAETAHHDIIAANAWIQLVIGAADEENAPDRDLEYITQAEGALARLGHPPLETALSEYAKGTTLTSLARFAEAEKSLRHAVELATSAVPSVLPKALHGVGYLYEQQGRYQDAVESYRLALDKLRDDDPTTASNAVTFRQRLAVNLAFLGRTSEAEAFARDAVDLAEQHLPPKDHDRVEARGILAEVLVQAGKLKEALVEVRTAERAVAAIEGERSRGYGELLQGEADILQNLGHYAEADTVFARACDIAAFRHGERSPDHAACQLLQVMALVAADQDEAALALIERALPVLVTSFGEPHPQVANGFALRGHLRVALGQRDAGIADLERAIASFQKITVDPGHLAAAQWGLAQALWDKDRARAQAMIEDALKTFEHASPTWATLHAEAKVWRETNGKPGRR